MKIGLTEARIQVCTQVIHLLECLGRTRRYSAFEGSLEGSVNDPFN